VTVELAPIGDGDVAATAAFLHANLNERVPADVWERMVVAPWPGDAPNRGFLLRDEGRIVGVHLAFYADRVIAGKAVRVCNLAAWCVLPSHRLHSLKLLKALLAQSGVDLFTDFSPSGSVVPLNRRLGFQELDTTTFLVPGLPWPSVPGRITVVSDPTAVERLLDPRELPVYRDHRRATAAHHLVLRQGDRHCWVAFRRDRRKGLPLFASVLHVGDPEVFQAGLTVFSRHLLVRRGIPAVLVEERLAGRLGIPAIRLRQARPKMYRGPETGSEDVDYFYSELTCVAW